LRSEAHYDIYLFPRIIKNVQLELGLTVFKCIIDLLVPLSGAPAFFEALFSV